VSVVAESANGAAHNVTAAALPDASNDLNAVWVPTAEPEAPTITELKELPPEITTLVASAELNPLVAAEIVVATALGIVMLKFSMPVTLVKVRVEVVSVERVVPTVTFRVSTPPVWPAML